MKSTIKTITFPTHDIRAILENRKTQIRQVVKVPNDAYIRQSGLVYYSPMQNQEVKKIPRYAVSDIIWCKETWCGMCLECRECSNDDYIYKASYNRTGGCCYEAMWRPSVHMPRDAARIFLEVTAVRAEHLNDITAHDVTEEIGTDMPEMDDDQARRDEKRKQRDIFRKLWDDKYGKKSGCAWSDNPWVFVYEFKRVNKPEGKDE